MSSEITRFRNIVWKYYRAHGRHDLPWRKTRNPYRILVSEIMLQQTQVERVIPFYRAWLRTFPTVQTLAEAPLGNVLKAWQGLGYNRRAKMLHQSAKAIVAAGGIFPKNATELEQLPGIGPYTAHAVSAFAYNKDGVFIETNIRTVITHHFFSDKKEVTDAEIRDVVERSLPLGNAREWYAALMDYGTFLKRSGVRLNTRKKGYLKQSPFIGSLREARGAVLKALAGKPESKTSLINLLGPARRSQITEAIDSLEKEGMVEHSRGKLRLPI